MNTEASHVELLAQGLREFTMVAIVAAKLFKRLAAALWKMKNHGHPGRWGLKARDRRRKRREKAARRRERVPANTWGRCGDGTLRSGKVAFANRVARRQWAREQAAAGVETVVGYSTGCPSPLANVDPERVKGVVLYVPEEP